MIGISDTDKRSEKDKLREALESLRQENSRLREALKKAHDAMMTWYSSEYAEHPLGKEIYRILHPPKP